MDSNQGILEKHCLKLALDVLYSTSIAGQMLSKLGLQKGLQKRLILFLPRRLPGLTCGVLANESIQVQP